MSDFHRIGGEREFRTHIINVATLQTLRIAPDDDSDDLFLSVHQLRRKIFLLPLRLQELQVFELHFEDQISLVISAQSKTRRTELQKSYNLSGRETEEEDDRCPEKEGRPVPCDQTVMILQSLGNDGSCSETEPAKQGVGKMTELSMSSSRKRNCKNKD